MEGVGTVEYRRLGSSGLEVSVVGVGCNTFGLATDSDAAEEVVRTALDLGITLFDTPEGHRNSKHERFLGKALGSDRDAVVIATKFNSPDRRYIDGAPILSSGSRRYIRYAVDRSLQRLGTDYIDLYQIHSPDLHAPIEETLDTLAELVS